MTTRQERNRAKAIARSRRNQEGQVLQATRRQARKARHAARLDKRILSVHVPKNRTGFIDTEHAAPVVILSDLNKADLLKIAEDRGVKVFPSWTKAKIIEALEG